MPRSLPTTLPDSHLHTHHRFERYGLFSIGMGEGFKMCPHPSSL